MNRRSVKPRSCWEDRFRVPSVSELRALLSKQHVQLFDVAREALLALDGVNESIEWRGVPWRWSLAFQTEPGRPLAYLVPQPARPRLAVPLSDEVVGSLAARKVSRPIRDAIVFAPRVGEVLWPSWELLGRNQIEELLDLVRIKYDGVWDAVSS